MTAFELEVVDVGPERLRDPQAVEGQKRCQRVVAGGAEPRLDQEAERHGGGDRQSSIPSSLPSAASVRTLAAKLPRYERPGRPSEGADRSRRPVSASLGMETSG